MIVNVKKRDGRIVNFNSGKITKAIYKALYNTNNGQRTKDMLDSAAKTYTLQVCTMLASEFDSDILDIEKIQDVVEKVLIRNNETDASKHYILYRNNRTKTREMNTTIMNLMKNITFNDSKDVDMKRENANIDGDSSMGTMLKYGSEVSKEFVKSFMLRPEIAEAHTDGDIHIHDMDFYNLTATCVQIDILKLFKNGFSTGHGTLREPNDIISASALTCIAIQSSQNDMHGGQSIPALDYYLAPYVKKTFIKQMKYILDVMDVNYVDNIIDGIEKYSNNNTSILSDRGIKDIENILIDCGITHNTKAIIDKAIKYTQRQTYQAMEAMVHNLNSMHSRAGAQVNNVA